MTSFAGMSAWAFGWDALVAIATLCLALATIALAMKTASLARATATDIAAQDRPVLVPLQADLSYKADTFDAEIVNAGRGVALDIQASATAAGQTTAADTWNKAALAPGASVELHFHGVSMTHADLLIVHLQYRDVANTVHTSEIIVDFCRDPRTGNGTRRYADTIIDGVSDSPARGQRPAEAAGQGERGEHPASRARVTDYVRAWRQRWARRWVLK